MAQTALNDSDYTQSLLAGLDLFADVRADDVQQLLQRCDRRDAAAGELLLNPHERNENVFVVLSGRLRVHVGAPETPPLAVMDVGACVGEMSIIEDRDPSAYVIAAEDSHLLVIHQGVLWELVNASHAFAKNLLVVMSERVRSHNKVIAENYGELRRYERNATTDALTGLGNRHSMIESFPREIERCRKDGQPIALMMIDIDNFKRFNDTFGHTAGDRALTLVSRTLVRQFRSRDVLVRYGGDEFAILLPNVDTEVAMRIGDRVRRAVSGDTGESHDSLIKMPIRISIGVAECVDEHDLDQLIRAADAALYRAKHDGRDTVSS